MIETYYEARKYIESFIPFIINHKAEEDTDPLGRMRHLLKLLGNPEKKFPSIIVSGTSGKGSVSYLLANILTRANYKTGLTISPHLQKITERMQINNHFLPNKKFIKLLNEIIPAAETMKKSKYGPPSYYEILLAMAFVAFVKEKVDIAIVEVGIEGKYDATNLVNPLIFVLNNISLDHTDILGNSVYKIAQEATYRIRYLKPIGKIKPIVITAVNQKHIISLVEDLCHKVDADLKLAKRDFCYKIIKETQEGVVFDFSMDNLKRYFVSLRGAYQASNAALAVTAAKELEKFGFKIPDKFLAKGLKTAVFPGRFEVFNYSGSTVILDGAHNAVKMRSFLKALKKLYPKQKKIFVVGFKKGKDIKNMLGFITKTADDLIITQFTTAIDWGLNFGMDSETAKKQMPQTKRIFDITYENNLKKAIDLSVKLNKDYSAGDTKAIIVVTGSLYLVGEVRSLLVLKS